MSNANAKLKEKEFVQVNKISTINKNISAVLPTRVGTPSRGELEQLGESSLYHVSAMY
jgi:hypothetical protein